MTKTAVIYFGNDLSESAFANDATRKARLDDGVRTIARIPGIQIMSRLSSVCAVIIRATEAALQELSRASHLGSVSVEDPDEPAFRAARKLSRQTRP